MGSSWKTLTVAIIAAAAFGGGYYLLRAGESTVAALEGYMREGQNAAPTLCVFPGASSFRVSVQDLKIQIENQNLRADWIQSESRQPNHIHAISNDNGKHYYVWSDEVQNPLIFTKEQLFKVDGIGFTNVSGGVCRPLWSPDPSLFVVPDTMTFKPYEENG